MKINLSSHDFPIIGIFTLFFCFSCKNIDIQSTANNFDVPTLIERGDKIKLGKEWDQIQNLYALKVSDLRKNENDNNAKLVLAQLFIKEARVTGEHGHYYPGSLKMLNSILKDQKIDKDLQFRALMTKAGVELSLHEFDQALATGKTALSMNNKNAQIYGVLVDANVELGNYKDAIAYADKMVSIKPDLKSYARVAYLREIHGDVEGAISALKLSVQAAYPGTEEAAWASQTLGDLLFQHERIQEAESTYNYILQTRKDYPFAVAALGDIYLEKNDLVKAEAKYKEAMGIIPEVGYYVQLAKLYKSQNRKAEMLSLKNEIFEMLEDDVSSGHNMNLEYADLYLNLLDDPEKALHYASIEFEKRPTNIDVNRMIAKIYLSLDNKAKAKDHTAMAGVTNSIHPDLKELQEIL